VLLARGARLGPYHIGGVLGAGGFGEVYQALDERLNRTVAIKILPSTDAHGRARFEREAKAIAALQHPHICTLFDIGHEGDTDYLVLEYLEGETLARRLGRGALAVAETLAIAIEIADALDRGHQAGVVHRDLKPANITLTRSGVKLLDFGLAKLRPPEPALGDETLASTDATAPITAEGAIVGTLQFIAPEQLGGKEADHRADIWALGCILYQMLSGEAPFVGSQAAIIGAILHVEPRPLSDLRPIPRTLDAAIRRCLAKDRHERWQSAHDLRLHLISIADPLEALRLSDPAGVASIVSVLMTPDARSYVYTYLRDLSDLYLVQNLN
jgi:eukaryotic-like serine/threonine-protein kinase